MALVSFYTPRKHQKTSGSGMWWVKILLKAHLFSAVFFKKMEN